MVRHVGSASLVLAVSLLAGCGGSPDGAAGSPATQASSGSSSGSSSGASSTSSQDCDGGSALTGDDGGTAPSSTDGSAPAPAEPAPPSSGTINFHLLLGVAGSDTPGDSLTLDGDNYTDLVMSNIVAGVMYGHLIQTYTPGMTFDADYLYGSIFAQLLQENIATEYYVATSSLLDPSPDQQAVMGGGQGGPYQINNYAADMVFGSYSPQGYSLINYVALQKNIGYSFASAATQYTQSTPAPFNDKFMGPMLTAYFHFNDYVALQQIGPQGGYTPAWEPDYDNALATFKTLPGNFLEVLLNVAYNQGYYGPLVSSYSKLGASASAATVSTVDGYGAVWGIDDTYQQYPYQVRYYLDQLYDKPIPTTSPTVTTTPTNHVQFGMSLLGQTFASVFSKLAYVDPKAGYVVIDASQASAAFATALGQAGFTNGTALDLSQAAQRAQIFALLEKAIATLEGNLATSFVARSTTAL